VLSPVQAGDLPSWLKQCFPGATGRWWSCRTGTGRAGWAGWSIGVPWHPAHSFPSKTTL